MTAVLERPYATHAGPDFHRWLGEKLDSLTADVATALKGRLVALLLGGGYGRGEGGIVTEAGEERPYNDLDLTIVLSDRGRLPAALDEVRHAHEDAIGVEVDFSRPLTIGDIRRWPHKMMWQDLLRGHHVLYGPEDVLTRHAPADILRPLPEVEGSRLLLNRGAGLLWARLVLEGAMEAPDPDFVRRNLYKAQLAIGDAMLVSYQRFQTAYRGRDAALAELVSARPELAYVAQLERYCEALDFKFSPDAVAGDAVTLDRLLPVIDSWGRAYLHVERRRLGGDWSSLADYCRWRGVRELDEHRPSRWARNIVRNAQHRRFTWRYLREALYRELPIELNLTIVTPRRERALQLLELWRCCN